MKAKLLAALAFLLGAVVLPAASVGAVPATNLTPDGTEQTVTASDGCTVKIKHFNFFGYAFSQMIHAAGGLTCREDAYVENISWNSSTHVYSVERCYIGSQVGSIGPGSCTRFAGQNGTAVYQAQSISGNSLIGSKLCLRGDLIECEDYEFGFSGTLSDPTHGTEVTLSDSGCSVEFAHGAFGTAAVSRIENASGCNLNSSYVEMTVVDTTDASVDTQRCFLNTGTTGNCSFYANGEQATIANSYILSSIVRPCPTTPATCVATPQFKPGL